jgi:type I restriction enzyme S subunit
MAKETALSAKYAAYSEYKDSDVDWLDEIPSHWTVKRIKNLSTLISKGTTPSTIGGDFVDFGVRFLKAENIGKSISVTSSPTFYITEEVDEQISRSRLKKYDVLVIIAGATTGLSSIVSQDVLPANTNQAVSFIRPTKREYAKFIVHWLSTNFAQRIIWMGAVQAAQPNLSMEDLGNIPISLPSDNELMLIANFLDHETAKIDTLIDKQQQLIILLKEKRHAVISHAVTKGLNPNAPMRDSGVEWLGEVPVHWDVRAVSKLSQKITNGYVGPTRDILVPEGVPYVQATHIKKGKVNFDAAYFVRQPWSDAHAKSILVKGDVLIVQTGAGTGDIGLVTENEDGFNCHALIIVQPIKNVISGDYLSMAFQSQYGYSVLYSIRTGGMHPHLNCGEVQFVKIPVPPVEEQRQIIEHIIQQLHKFDTLVDRQLLAIELMKERRTALISAAVTGKIDVRNWVAPQSSNNNKEVSP